MSGLPRMTKTRAHLARSALLAATIAGCNTILDNQPGTLDPTRPSDASSVEPGADGGPPSNTPDGSSSRPDGGQSGTDANVSSDCAGGQHLCHGVCVGDTDPTYGCGAPSCDPCTATHGTAACQGNACVMQACDRGYADCNQLPTDGCEVDLSKATTCGACNATCPAGAPVCAPAGDSFQCTTGCTPAAPLLCGSECVSPQTSVNHCGACNAKCADVEHGEVGCVGSLCTLTCKPDYHACAGKCAVNSDPMACGPACTVCPLPANATPTCQADACGLVCNPGFGNCNDNLVDGCEAILSSDPLHCGGCGKPCNGGTCNAGVCTPPPPDAGP